MTDSFFTEQAMYPDLVGRFVLDGVSDSIEYSQNLWNWGRTAMDHTSRVSFETRRWVRRLLLIGTPPLHRPSTDFCLPAPQPAPRAVPSLDTTRPSPPFTRASPRSALGFTPTRCMSLRRSERA